MIPIEKNIIVVDENGTVFEPTWLKRANGLVKKGRARWLDERTICLACPPEQMEDNEMENSKQTEAVTERIAGTEDTRLGSLTIGSLLDRMDAIRKEMLLMKELLSTMESISNQGGEDDAGHIAEATSQAFIARETTCQQQLRFLEMIYRDHFSKHAEAGSVDRTKTLLEQMPGVLAACNNSPDAFESALGFYRDLLKQS